MPTLAITLGVTVMPAGRAVTVAATSGASAIVALAVGLAVLLSRRAALRPTTLMAAWVWAVAALVGWSVVELAAAVSAAGSGGSLRAPLRLAVMALSFCPVVALLGAKRPQHQAWNFIVVSLWGIVALPAAENFFLHPGQKLEMGDARGWFLWILILLGPINFIPTRYWLASLVLASGQVITLSPYLVFLRRPLTPQPELIGLVLAVAALVIAWLASRRVTVATNSNDRLWLDFRDTFGLLWGLRVQERVNAVARQCGWDLELTWNGFRSQSSDEPLPEIDPAIESGLRTTFKGLLRRFVSNEWIDSRASRVPISLGESRP